MFTDFISAWSSIDDMSAFLYASAMVVFNLILIEGLLSVDNALGIAAMAANLPKNRQKAALRWGLLGAYLFRGIALALVSWLMQNMWVKWFGALYLIYLASEHIQLHPAAEKEGHAAARTKGKSFLMTILSIELMDLSLSLDNVVAAVGMVNGVSEIPEALHLAVVCLGVFIGIAALRMVAGWCIGLLEKHPVLKYTAFLLVGFVGLTLCAELGLEQVGVAFRIGIIGKFSVICGIVAASLLYERWGGLHRALSPLVHGLRAVCSGIVAVVHAPFSLAKHLLNK